MASTETLNKTVSAVFTLPLEPLVNIGTDEISSETAKKLSESVLKILNSWRGTEWKRSDVLGNFEKSKSE